MSRQRLFSLLVLVGALFVLFSGFDPCEAG